MRTLSVIGFVFAFGCALAACNGGGRQTASGAIEVGSCYVGGCSSELCSNQENVASPCIFRSEYACYRSGICEPQRDGECGWTQSRELTECLTSGGP